MPWNSRRWCRSAAGKDSAASPTSTARASKPSPGRPASAHRPAIRRCSPPRTSSPCIRSWRPSRPLPSTTSPAVGSLNVVTGWHRPEMEMFGAPFLDHDVRYDLSVEWLAIIKRLWTEDDEFDFDGKYFKIRKGYLAPKPIQKPFSGGDERRL